MFVTPIRVESGRGAVSEGHHRLDETPPPVGCRRTLDIELSQDEVTALEEPTLPGIPPPSGEQERGGRTTDRGHPPPA